VGRLAVLAPRLYSRPVNDAAESDVAVERPNRSLALRHRVDAFNHFSSVSCRSCIPGRRPLGGFRTSTHPNKTPACSPGRRRPTGRTFNCALSLKHPRWQFGYTAGSSWGSRERMIGCPDSLHLVCPGLDPASRRNVPAMAKAQANGPSMRIAPMLIFVRPKRGNSPFRAFATALGR